ncbi:MAG TPA: DUF1415 domain-containing protein [Gammaproteobacteria bacterium]|nr:DUF1415 domain-containing protein [Gammaproteobacteria bacterium]
MRTNHHNRFIVTPDTETIIQQTKNWVSEIVIDLQLCPFASAAFNTNNIDYTVVHRRDITRHLQQIADCFTFLDDHENIETQLLIFSDAYKDFDNYLDLLHLANQILEDLKYTGIYQLASFHPLYRFADSMDNDASNYSNRSPYPMLHILREKSLEQAITGYPDIEKVPEKNIRKLNKIGYVRMRKKLDSIVE